jgi:hypothetical protein
MLTLFYKKTMYDQINILSVFQYFFIHNKRDGQEKCIA